MKQPLRPTDFSALLRRARPVRAALLAAILGLLVAAGCSSPSPDTALENAPAFSLPSIDGAKVNLTDYQGKVVLLDFWATWCPPCRAAMPHLAKLQEQHRSDGLVVLGMSMDKNREDLDSFLSSQNVNYPMLLVDEDTRLAFGGVASIPQTFLVDRKGRIRHKFLGYDHKIASQMEAKILELLGEAP